MCSLTEWSTSRTNGARGLKRDQEACPRLRKSRRRLLITRKIADSISVRIVQLGQLGDAVVAIASWIYEREKRMAITRSLTSIKRGGEDEGISAVDTP